MMIVTGIPSYSCSETWGKKCKHTNFKLKENNPYHVTCLDCKAEITVGMYSSWMLMNKVFEQEERIKKLEYALANFLQ
jgi:hypothetical protein